MRPYLLRNATVGSCLPIFPKPQHQDPHRGWRDQDSSERLGRIPYPLVLSSTVGKWRLRDPKVAVPVSTTIVPDVPQIWVRVSDNLGTIVIAVDDSIFARGNIPQVPSIGVPFELPLVHISYRHPEPSWHVYLLVITAVVRIANDCNRNIEQQLLNGEISRTTHPNCYRRQKDQGHSLGS